MTTALTKRLLHFLSWRQWGVLHLNPVFENTFALFFVLLANQAPLAAVSAHLGLFFLLVLAMSSYGFLLNDAVDCGRDVEHGYDNVFRGKPPWGRGTVVAISLAANVPFLVYFADRIPWFLATWLTWFLLASAYSFPGIYLKGRGLSGLVAVTLALRTLPVLLLLEVFDPSPDAAWALILTYVTLRGFGSDLAHQLTDFDEDTEDGISTFAVKNGFRSSFTLLDKTLQTERIALLGATGWMLWSLAHESDRHAVVPVTGVVFFALTLALVIYAFQQTLAGVKHCNPHQPHYPEKDVFYLLHKSFPKIVLSLYLLCLLVLEDVTYAFVLFLLAAYFGLFSRRKIVGALRIKPQRGGDDDC